jgi:hypothetical protein
MFVNLLEQGEGCCGLTLEDMNDTSGKQRIRQL